MMAFCSVSVYESRGNSSGTTQPSMRAKSCSSNSCRAWGRFTDYTDHNDQWLSCDT